MHEQMTLTFVSQILDLASTLAIGGFGVWVYKKNKTTDKGFELDKKWKENVNEQLSQNSTDIRDIQETLSQNKKEDMAQLRVTILVEMKRCLRQGFRTETDNEMIEPLLDIYFDAKHNGNGRVKEYTKAYHQLELRVDRELE